jgi:hypothetical protein
MKKKIVIIYIFAFIAVILLIFNFTIFTVKYSNVIFKNQNDSFIDIPKDFDVEKFNESIKWVKGKNIIFLGKTKLENEIEMQYPQLKVIGIEKIFPNNINIFLVERETAYYLVIDNKFICIDNENKIIKIENSEPKQGVRLTGVEKNWLLSYNYGSEIKFIDNYEWYGDFLITVNDALWQLGYNVGTVNSMFSFMSIEMKDVYYRVTFETLSGGKYILDNPNKNTRNRIIALYGALNSPDAEKDKTYIINENAEPMLIGD